MVSAYSVNDSWSSFIKCYKGPEDVTGCAMAAEISFTKLYVYVGLHMAHNRLTDPFIYNLHNLNLFSPHEEGVCYQGSRFSPTHMPPSEQKECCRTQSNRCTNELVQITGKQATGSCASVVYGVNSLKDLHRST